MTTGNRFLIGLNYRIFSVPFFIDQVKTLSVLGNSWTAFGIGWSIFVCIHL